MDKYTEKTFDTIGRDEPRIVIPMYDETKNLIGFQGRALDKSPNKYITIMIQDEAPKAYGIETIDKTSTVYITEGPFDSTFIRNSIAMCRLMLILVVGGLAILFGFMITNPGTERLSTESRIQSIVATP